MTRTDRYIGYAVSLFALAVVARFAMLLLELRG